MTEKRTVEILEKILALIDMKLELFKETDTSKLSQLHFGMYCGFNDSRGYVQHELNRLNCKIEALNEETNN